MNSASEHASRCAILIGGAGSRIGGDKHLRELGGRSLAGWVIDAVRKARLEPLLVAKHGTPLGELAGACEVAVEPEAEHHPLLGLIAALELTREPLVVTPCDVPLVPPALLRELAEAEGTAVVDGPDGVEPLLGRYEPAALPVLREAVRNGASARSAAEMLGAAEIGRDELDRYGDPVRFLSNVNVPDDLLILERELTPPGEVRG